MLIFSKYYIKLSQQCILITLIYIYVAVLSFVIMSTIPTKLSYFKLDHHAMLTISKMPSNINDVASVNVLELKENTLKL